MARRISLREIEAGRSPAGGWTRKQLKAWGVPWPPPKGWKSRLQAGEDPAGEHRSFYGDAATVNGDWLTPEQYRMVQEAVKRRV